MQRWEYCAVGGVGESGGNFDTFYPVMWLLTPEGAKNFNVRGGKEEKEVVAKAIANLGLAGWELVGVHGENWATLFFKRPLP